MIVLFFNLARLLRQFLRQVVEMALAQDVYLVQED